MREGLLRASAGGDAAAVRSGLPGLDAARATYVDSIVRLSEFERRRAARLGEHVLDASRQGPLLLGGICAAALALAAACTAIVTRSITRPLRRAMALAGAVAAGRLSQRVEPCARDETGQLLAALHQMNADLFRIVSAVRDSGVAIVSASDEIAAGNEDLSARTERQAGALEETAASMEELTAAVKHNADSVRQAGQLASVASEAAARGGAVVAQVVGTMESISASANRITDITGVIDSIAFQTNLLALNAAVEAARAGEHGRGFAVVATEVRNLAQRAAGAAREIKSLIDASVGEVASGTELAGKAGATMEEVVASFRRVSAIMHDIAQANGEQESGIAQINAAIGQMDGATQQNAALVEEAAAASQALRGQAAELGALVGAFTLEDSAQTAPHPQRAAPRMVPHLA